MSSLANKRIWIAGHNGMVGSALQRRLASEDCVIISRDRQALDLRVQSDVDQFLRSERPDIVIIAAARVGGILANDRSPADFLADNLLIASNVITGAHKADVDRLLFLGSSCVYPKFAAQPIAEAALLSGALEPTNEWYALAKIAGIKLAEAYARQYGRSYISAMPCNLYGPGDNFDLSSGHVLPALMHRFHDAKIAGDARVTIWGSGTPTREFLHVDDCAEALVLLLKHYSGTSPVNVGSGGEISIQELATQIAEAVGFRGTIANDPNRPDGTPAKLMDSSRLRAMGWSPATDLRQGIAQTYQWFLRNQAQGRAA